jgi:hypothetical protein
MFETFFNVCADGGTGGCSQSQYRQDWYGACLLQCIKKFHLRPSYEDSSTGLLSRAAQHRRPPAISPAVPVCARPVDRRFATCVRAVLIRCMTMYQTDQCRDKPSCCTFASNCQFANLYIATQSANIARISVTAINGDFRRGYDAVQ